MQRQKADIYSVVMLYLLFGSVSICRQMLLQGFQLVDSVQSSLLNRH